METFLLALLALSFGGAMVILVLLLLERVGGLQYAARWRCLAWLLLCLRLALPMSILPDHWELTRAPIQVEVPADRVLYQYTPPDQPPEVQGDPVQIDQPIEARQEEGIRISLSQVLFLVWLLGGLSVLTVNSIRHGHFLAYLHQWGWPEEEEEICDLFHHLSRRLKLKKRPALWSCVDIRSPMLVGVLRPRLILPAEDMDREALAYAILHELTHFKSRHIWLKALVLWVCALHWFNPLVWLMARSVERATELDCDERVLQTLPKEHRAAYSRTIVDAAAGWKGGNP